MTPYESGLAAALSPEKAPAAEQLKAKILSIYAKFNLFDGTVHQRAALHLHLDGLLAKLATKAMPTQMIKTDRVTVEHSSSVDAVGGGLAVDKRLAHITLKQNAAQDRAYIESCFGRSLYPPERLRKAEQELCVGDHLGCHLWFSAGVPSPEQAPTPEAKHLAEQAELQATATALITPKIGNCTAVWCCGLPSRSATAFLCTSSPTPVLPAVAT